MQQLIGLHACSPSRYFFSCPLLASTSCIDYVWSQSYFAAIPRVCLRCCLPLCTIHARRVSYSSVLRHARYSTPHKGLLPTTSVYQSSDGVFIVMLFRHACAWQKGAERVKKWLLSEKDRADFPIKMQMLDVRAMDRDPANRSRRLELCISLQVTHASLP